jgi:hypothetical protein
MATTTPNFNFPIPQSTDLVKDGATAIAALGTSVDTQFVDLKGGTTGQILAKNSNTDLDYSWVTTDDANAIQNAIVDAKGDLISATGNDTPARLAVGSNGDHLVADSTTSTGLRYQSAYNGNAIINGGYDIWARGTSFTSQGSLSLAYTADRWHFYRAAGATGATLSRQASSLTGIQYCARVQRDSGNTGTGSINLRYTAESADSYRFAGQTVTVSFYARAGANFSATSNAFVLSLVSGTGTDQPVYSFTGSATVATTTATLTTSWQRFSVSGAVSSSATEIGIESNYTPTGTAGANDYFEITGVQLELGSVPSTFKRAGGGSIQQELALCQRYYYRNTGTSLFSYFCGGAASSTTAASVLFNMPVQMRVKPTSLDYGNVRLSDFVSGFTISALTLSTDGNSPNVATLDATGATGLTQFRPYFLGANNNTAAFVGVSAEL